jgi:16S rRNA (uracil1498-N3)-methyltransferase
MTQLFLHKQLDETSEHIRFDSEESRHISKVLRKKEGDLLDITNGNGIRFRAELTSASPRSCTATIREHSIVSPQPYELHLAVAPLKSNERFEWLLEKCTELGVTKISPVWCEHSERRIAKPERWQRIVESALKQSLRDHLPVLNEPAEFRDWVRATQGEKRFLAHCRNTTRMEPRTWLKEVNDSLILAIGPEGDFSRDEIDLAEESGFRSIALGDYRLRTETAAISAVALSINELQGGRS